MLVNHVDPQGLYMATNKHAQMNYVVAFWLCCANNYVPGQIRAQFILFAHQFIPKTCGLLLMHTFKGTRYLGLLALTIKDWYLCISLFSTVFRYSITYKLILRIMI